MKHGTTKAISICFLERKQGRDGIFNRRARSSMNPVFTPNDLQKKVRERTRGGGYFIQTWGCQMNVEDSEQLEIQLKTLGFKPALSPFDATIILLNTCSVRKKPEDKAFSFLGELALVKQKKPELIVGVCGCMAQVRANEILRRAPHVDFVLGTGDLSQLTGLIEEVAQGKRLLKRIALPERKGAIVTDIPHRNVADIPKLKAFVPIQYGCDKFCTFCIVPSTRGRERSRPTQEIIDEVTQLARQGTKEITLLGQTVNSYGKNLLEGRVPFCELLLRLSDIQGLERIRFMSPYPRDFTPELIQVIRDCPKVMEHVHLPLQSGADSVLKRMKRQYSVLGFLEIVEKLRCAVPGIGITTDIIVGFPGETDDEFEETLNIVRSVRFDGCYSFAYSIRPGTPAADMPQVSQSVKMERLNRLIDLQSEITSEIHQSLVGQNFEVMIDGVATKEKGMLVGRTREFRLAKVNGNADRVGRICKINVTSASQASVTGELL